MIDALCGECREHFEAVRGLLEEMGVAFRVDPRLVRGLDYYTRTTFELISTAGSLGSQNTIAGGGRYDGLVQQLGGRDTPAVGFAVGMERLVLMLADAGAVSAERPADIYAMSVGQGAHRAALAAVEALRDASPQLKVIQHAGGGSFKSQMKKADKSGARVALIWGEDEAASGSVTVRPLREGAGGERGEQRTVPVSELQAALDAVLAP
jgi:histidyl-tRNA synthetase